MTRKTKIWLFCGLGCLVWLLLIFFLARWLGLHGTDALVLRLVLWFCGLVATGVLIWFLLGKEKQSPAPPPGIGDDIDAAIATARNRLASSKVGDKAAMAKLPLVLWLGPEGSAKTTAVVRSGLEPDLLAGEVFRGEAIAATRTINVWYSNKAIFLEAGGPVTADAGRWARLVRHTQPRRLAAVFSRGEQAPRVAVVCLSSEALLAPGGSEAVLATARDLRARLSDVSRRLGIRLPVYVLFTKADRIPYFTEFVRNLSTEEAQDVLGATLPFDSGPAGSYADRVHLRLSTQFQRLFQSLAARRLVLLPREADSTTRGNAYEFAREFRKLAPLAAQFLTDLCKPSQLEVSPWLRGFYFTGVRAVIINEAAPQTPQQPQGSSSLSSDATQAFTPVFRQQPQAVASAGPTQRKVPQWVFLDPVIRSVVLKDRVAMGVTAGGARVNLLRRGLLIAVSALAMIWSLGLIVSFAYNRGLETEVLDTGRELAAAAAPTGDLPPVETLRRLDSLRERVSEVLEWNRTGAPLHLRWGLYAGHRLEPELRRLYFGQFATLLFDPTREAIVRTMNALPAVPQGTEYPATRDLLKAHLITTAYPDKSTVEFMAPLLLQQWVGDKNVDDERKKLALAQFEFYAGELPHGNPYSLETDTTAVDHARAFLRQFTGSIRIYQFMLSEASKDRPPVNFARAVPGAGGVLSDAYEVPAAFTRGGWEFMQNVAFKNVDRFFEGESWVLGDNGLSDQDKAKVVSDLRTQYRSDYVKAWRSFLAQARVGGYSGPQDAAQKLAALSGNQSPLLQLFLLVSKNTAVDSSLITREFQPVHLLTPSTLTDKLIGDKNQPYMGGLVNLQAAVEQLATAPPGQGDAAVGKAVSDAGNTRTAARQIAQGFSTDPNSVGSDVLRLMLDPLTSVERLLGGFGAAGLNKSGKDFCRPLERMLTASPFRAGTTAQASLADVTAQFQRSTGAIWSFYNEVLAKYLVQQGSRYAPRPGSDIPLSSNFVEFFNRAAAFSDALYPQNQPGPRLAFTLKPLLSDLVTSVTIVIDGRTAVFTRTSAAAQPFLWVGGEAREARMSAQVGGNEFTISNKGTWAVFQLFQAAEGWRTEGIVQKAQWTTRHQGQAVNIPFELNLAGSPPIFDRGYFGSVSCTGQIAR
jgi:type VI secretion system protein ImpL